MFLREKIDPASIELVTSFARLPAFINAYGGDWAADRDRDAFFFFEGADPLDSTLPRHYRLMLGGDLFGVEILDSCDSWWLKQRKVPGGIAKILIRNRAGQVGASEGLKQVCIEAYRCLHRSNTQNFETVLRWDHAADFGIPPS